MDLDNTYTHQPGGHDNDDVVSDAGHNDGHHTHDDNEDHQCCKKLYGKANQSFITINKELAEKVKTDSTLKSALETLSSFGFVNLSSLHALHVATKGKYRSDVSKLRKKVDIDKIKEYRKEYSNRPHVKERIKEYNAQESVKERKKQNQKKRNAVITKLRKLDPALLTKLMWEESVDSHEEKSV